MSSSAKFPALLFCSSLVILGSAYAAPSTDVATPGYAPNRLLIGTRAGLSDSEVAKILTVHGAKAHRIGSTQLHIVDLPGNGSAQAIATLLAKHPALKFVERDRQVHLALTPNDPYLGSEWHLNKIGAGTAWDVGQGAGVTIAIIDTGVDGTHPELGAKMVAGWNFYDNNSNTADVQGHGTAVAGAAAATTNNGTGVAGVSGLAKIMPIRVTDANGYTYWSTVASALNWAADNGARVANVSFGGVSGSSTVQAAADYMRSKGGLVVAAAGNNGIDEHITPTTSLITVSATDSSDTKTSWSSYGDFVTIAAPGQDIWTTTKGGGYQAWWGTSLATPVVSGVIGVLMSSNLSLTNSQIEKLLYSSATDLGAAGRDSYYGYGRVNAAAAVQAAKATLLQDTTAPTVSISAPISASTVSGLVAVNTEASDNIGVSRVELRVDSSTVGSDTSAPFGFSWDSSKVSNGSHTLVAVAYDAAGNSQGSAPVTINVANPVLVDTSPPVVSITNPKSGSTLSGTVSVTVAATDDSGSAGIRQRLYVDGLLVASGSGGSLSYNWNTRKIARGLHTLQAVAQDSAGNSATTSVQVSR